MRTAVRMNSKFKFKIKNQGPRLNEKKKNKTSFIHLYEWEKLSVGRMVLILT